MWLVTRIRLERHGCERKAGFKRTAVDAASTANGTA
jgi:hypothetical protein